MRPFVRVLDAQYVADYRVRFRFTDATERVIDLRPFMRARCSSRSCRIVPRLSHFAWMPAPAPSSGPTAPISIPMFSIAILSRHGCMIPKL